MPLPKSLDVGVPIAPFEDWTIDVEIVTLDPDVTVLMRARNIAR